MSFQLRNIRTDNPTNAKVLDFAVGRRNRELAGELKISRNYLYRMCLVAFSENDLTGTGVQNILDWIEYVIRAFWRWRGLHGVIPIWARVTEIVIELTSHSPSPVSLSGIWGIPPFMDEQWKEAA